MRYPGTPAPGQRVCTCDHEFIKGFPPSYGQRTLGLMSPLGAPCDPKRPEKTFQSALLRVRAD
jgi:hypothetical protein